MPATDAKAEAAQINETNNLTVQEPQQPPKVKSDIATFHQRRFDIYDRLKKIAEECQKRFGDRRELATESDEKVFELCEVLEETFQYGLRQQQSTFVISAAHLFQNMHEIVTGRGMLAGSNELCFWDFCKQYLTNHERQRFEQLSCISTKGGRGRAFIRASLNEHSLERYLLMWLADPKQLSSYYTHWSLLIDEEISVTLPEIIKSLDNILFALNLDKCESNSALKNFCFTLQSNVEKKEEPIIYAPAPVKVKNKTNNKNNAIERHIETSNSTEDLLKSLPIKTNNIDYAHSNAVEECKSITKEILTPFSGLSSAVSIEDNSRRSLTEIDIITKNDLINGSTASMCSSNEAYISENKSESSSLCSKTSSSPLQTGSEQFEACQIEQHLQLENELKDANERCNLLETRVAQLSLENRQLIRRLKQYFQESGIDPTSSFATNFLITIPHVKLHKSKRPTTGKYYLYEIHITMRQNLEHWSTWRRYNDFDDLHKSLLKTHPSVALVEFPGKKRFGNMNKQFVDERRQQLQIYLLNLVETLPQLEACKSKAELQKVFPFLRER
uniref:Sorting nexin-29 n=1 Tax=Glossina brevipalpis TaxID=37001 RepID=A0A1A9WKZ3_9MUSC